MECDFFCFEEAYARKLKMTTFYDGLKRGHANVYIFGAGIYAKELEKYLIKKNIEVKGFFVDDLYADEKKGFLPYSSLAAYENVVLFYGIGGGFSKNFVKKTKQISSDACKFANFCFFVPSDYWMIEIGSRYFSHDLIDFAFLESHFAEFKKTYEMLSDDLSKTVMTEYLYSSVCHDASRLAQLGANWDFDYDLNLLFRNCNGDVVVECGAYDGKTMEEASKFTNNKYEMIALECDPENYKNCCKRLRDFPNIRVLQLGAWDKKTKLAVVQLESASFLKEVDENTEIEDVVEVTSVDSLVASKKIAAIIMDIEGSEMKALMGARCAIEQGANLAVRVYHRKDDLVTIPQYIRSLNKNYKFYLRFERGANLCRSGDETTLYAICE